MRIEEVVSSAEQRSVDLKKQAAKRAALSAKQRNLAAKKADANLKIRKAQQQLQKLNTA